MSLQELEQEIASIEAKFKEKFEKQKTEFELKYQNQKNEFTTKHQELEQSFQSKYNQDKGYFDNKYATLESEFKKTIKDLGNNAIQSILNQTPKISKPTTKLSFDKTIDPVQYAAFDKKPT